MRMRAFGVAPARPVTPPIGSADREPPIPAPAASDGIGHAYAVDTDSSGLVRRLLLPGQLAGVRAPLFVPTSDGSAWRIGWIQDAGKVQGDPGNLPCRFDTGTEFVAAMTPGGKVLSVTAVPPKVPPRAPAPAVKRRAALPARTRTRSADPYEHDPHEVLIAGAGGRVISVR